MKNMSLITKIRRRLKDKKGQSTTEYILILAIVVMIASKMKVKLQNTVDSAVGGVGTIIDQTVSEMGSNR
jgi:Flp pilus assembly pilin Flp